MPYVPVNDLEMFYEKMGVGEAVIFLHSGYSRGILAFAGQMLDFQKSFTCFFPDFRGHGRTRCESLTWSTPRLADDMILFMDRLNIPKAHLIGYSLGANVGLYIAAGNPDRVATLTTIGTSGFCDPSGVEEFEPEWLLLNEKRETIDLMMERHEEAHRGDWQTFMRQSALDWRLHPQLSEERIAEIRSPCLFIAGEFDPFADERRLKRLSSLVQGSRYFVVPGGSHKPHMVRENPIFVNDEILAFIRSYPI